jgi:DNA mismatch endonuclease (patch repair protein)
MMSGIRGKDTKPEMLIRRALHARGFRFRLHDRRLPGRPDLVLPKYQTVIFVHGCFWHGHNCHLFKWPQTRLEFWRKKIEANKARDVQTLKTLRDAGWQTIEVWECALKGKDSVQLEKLVAGIERQLARLDLISRRKREIARAKSR